MSALVVQVQTFALASALASEAPRSCGAELPQFVPPTPRITTDSSHDARSPGIMSGQSYGNHPDHTRFRHNQWVDRPATRTTYDQALDC